jgi:2-polyprenyl-6-hydroxyphenyl methylase/3-demethylubiquinone-9 3-methyltransferase
VIGRIEPGGRLFIALYNDQGRASRFWWHVKRTYCSGLPGRVAVLGTLLPYYVLRHLLGDLVHLRNPWALYRDHAKRHRGMSRIHDYIDWFGGFPFEVATPEAVRSFCRDRGLVEERADLIATGWACNQFVFSAPQKPTLA